MYISMTLKSSWQLVRRAIVLVFNSFVSPGLDSVPLLLPKSQREGLCFISDHFFFAKK